MANRENRVSLEIAHLLLSARRELSTKEIVQFVGCDRKTVYSVIDQMEINGFITNVVKRNGNNYYSCSI